MWLVVELVQQPVKRTGRSIVTEAHLPLPAHQTAVFTGPFPPSATEQQPLLVYLCLSARGSHQGEISPGPNWSGGKGGHWDTVGLLPVVMWHYDPVVTSSDG